MASVHTLRLVNQPGPFNKKILSKLYVLYNFTRVGQILFSILSRSNLSFSFWISMFT
ncbi:MAG: hypothetical protein BWY04_00597 [candidate division CPR1 bacterium ADurb.Bin160]|uniref:Uncharacterized protein n=1 Tax=candidate division CPR1 bacterium ADurb.Bin160 TaxID=1852826 RepID=A0A1V5ZPK6_9BACT|nr:MAG: hypothetical protein BWY04_00597 [candidate division CPR1 bacterium ADurb.Bin160]